MKRRNLLKSLLAAPVITPSVLLAVQGPVIGPDGPLVKIDMHLQGHEEFCHARAYLNGVELQSCNLCDEVKGMVRTVNSGKGYRTEIHYGRVVIKGLTLGERQQLLEIADAPENAKPNFTDRVQAKNMQRMREAIRRFRSSAESMQDSLARARDSIEGYKKVAIEKDKEIESLKEASKKIT